MKELVCINTNNSVLVENEIYHLQDVVSCNVCDLTSYALYESKPICQPTNMGTTWYCLKCKQAILNPLNKIPYSDDRFVELDFINIDELISLANGVD